MRQQQNGSREQPERKRERERAGTHEGKSTGKAQKGCGFLGEEDSAIVAAGPWLWQKRAAEAGSRSGQQKRAERRVAI
jgi:hypothetical protein